MAAASNRFQFWETGKFIYLLFLLEVLFLTYLRNSLGPFISPLVFYLVSGGFCLAALKFFLDRPLPANYSFSKSSPWLTVLFLFLTGLLATAYLFRITLKAFPIDEAYSDIVPALQIYVRRLLAGTPVYTQFFELKNPIFPNYLPAMWFPFTLAEIFNFDYRRLAYDVFLGGTLAYLLLCLRQRFSFYELLFKGLLPFLLFIMLVQCQPDIIGGNIETLIYGYYFLLAASIFSRSVIFKAAAILLCLLSRYTFIFWLPLYLLLIYLEGKKKDALLISALVAAGVIAFYVIPFLSTDWSIFLKAQDNYTTAALGEWQHIYNNNNKPVHLFRGMGFAVYFYKFLPGSLLYKISVVRAVHLFVSVGSVLLVAWVYFKYRGRIDYRLFSLLSLKFCIITFYAFIQVPYSYLLALGVLLSIFILLFIPQDTAKSTAAKQL